MRSIIFLNLHKYVYLQVSHQIRWNVSNRRNYTNMENQQIAGVAEAASTYGLILRYSWNKMLVNIALSSFARD